MSGFFSGSFEPFWPHVVLLTVAVIASFAVAFGIVLENPKWSLANVLVVGGVAVEAACTLLLFGFDEGISMSQQATIAAQQRVIRGREISSDQAKSVIGTLKGQRTPPFTVLTVPDIEAGRFAISIWELLREADVKADTKF